jgi:hypothetical protein
MESETKSGVFVSAITQDKWLRQTHTLKGEDLLFFVQKCHPALLISSDIIFLLGVDKETLFEILKSLEPDFNPETDYYAIRYAPDI